MNKLNIWLYRGLVIITTGMMVISWLIPWWSCDAEGYMEDAIVIHPYGLVDNIGMADQLGGTMPSWFAAFMWTYLGLAVVALLVGILIQYREFHIGRMKFNLPSFIIGLAGFSYIVVAIVAVIFAAVKTGDISNMHLIGRTYIRLGGGMNSWVIGTLLFGYWLACATGVVLIILAILRNRIIGNTKSYEN
jgi:hypothetical protein